MAYGIKVVLPFVAIHPTGCTASFDVPMNDALLATEVDHIKDLRDEARIKYATY